MARTKSPKAEHEANELIQKGLPCEDTSGCGSSDAMALYSDGHRYCFSCGKSFHDEGHSAGPRRATKVSKATAKTQELLDAGTHRAIKSRGITLATAKFFDYRTRQAPNGHWQQLAPYRDRATRQLAGVKVRDTGKDGTAKEFFWDGSSGEQLWGSWLWPAGGRRLVIVGGEIDAMSLAQAYSLKYPVVSCPNGEKEAAKAIKANLEYVLSFDEVVLGFDNDTVGNEANLEAAKLLPPGRCKIARWAGKDPNEMLVAGQTEQLTWAVHSAETFRPDGILDARTLTAECLKAPTWGIPWPWDPLTKYTYGRRPCEVITLGAGYGIGKTDWEAEVIACTLKGEDKHGNTFTPEACAGFPFEGGGAAGLKKSIAGKLWGRRFHLPPGEDGVEWTQEEHEAAMEYMDTELWNRGGKLFLNDNRGASDWDTIKDRIRYLAHGENVKHFFIDPISALVEEEGEDVDERKFLDQMVREAAKLAEELRVTIYLFSHLARPKDGRSHEEGGQVRGNQFRGSNGIGMFSDYIMGLERNTQAETEDEKITTTFRMVKDRKSGNSTGKTFQMKYDRLSGTLDLAEWVNPTAPSPDILSDEDTSLMEGLTRDAR